MKKIIVTGVTGQDGSHMVDYLLKNTDHKIYGTARRLSVKNHENILHLENEERFKLLDLDLNDAHSIRDVIIDIKPDYFINFAAQSFVAGSWKYPIQTWETDSSAVLHILESIRRFAPDCRFYNAGSSEEFGDLIYSPQDEDHPLMPLSPYGAAKCASRHIVRVYKESYGLYAIQPWLYNHEGVRRGLDFVTRKITNSVAKIKIAMEEGKELPTFELGNLNAKRDWSDAEDFMEAIWLMLNQDEAKSYVLSSGKMHSVREFVEESFKCAEIKGNWSFAGTKGNYIPPENEVFRKDTGEILLRINPKFYRPAEVHKLCGDSFLAESELRWKRKTNFKKLVDKMYQNDYNLLKL